MYCLKNEQWFLSFNYSLFQIHFPRFSISFKYYFFINSLFILFFLSSFILSIFIPNNYIFQWKVIYPQHFLQYFHKNHIKILCGKLLLVLIWIHRRNFFYSPILTNNNLLLKIYCENIIAAFLNCHFFLMLSFLS